MLAQITENENSDYLVCNDLFILVFPCKCSAQRPFRFYAEYWKDVCSCSCDTGHFLRDRIISYLPRPENKPVRKTNRRKWLEKQQHLRNMLASLTV